MNAEKVGIESIKLVAMWGISLGKDVVNVFEDGKVKFWEAFKFVDEIKELETIVPLLPNLKEEYQDLSLDELGKLNDLVAGELNMEGSKAAKFVEAGLSVAFGVSQLIDAFKDE